MKTSLDQQANFSNTLWHQIHICHSCHTHIHISWASCFGPLFRTLYCLSGHKWKNNKYRWWY
jgi:hypothetical protein